MRSFIAFEIIYVINQTGFMIYKVCFGHYS